MSDIKNTVVLYRCTKCGAIVSSVPGVFTLSADMLKIHCACRRDKADSGVRSNLPEEGALVIRRQKGGRINIIAPCLFCHGDHAVTLSPDVLDGFSYPCPITGYDMLFVGDSNEAAAAADRVLMEAAENNR